MKAIRNLVRNAIYGIGALPGVSSLVRPWKGRGAILCYHRVLPDGPLIDQASPNRSLVVSVERFEEQMQHLAAKYRVVSLDRFVEHVSGSDQGFAVAVTFDDGYRDNFLYAYPILKRYGIPATIYIITRFLEGDTSMWWYELWEKILAKDVLAIEVRGQRREWRIGSLHAKLGCFEHVKVALLRSSREEYLELLRQISADTPPKQYLDACLTRGEIRHLDEGNLITIGAHTHQHFCLSGLSEADAREEMLRSKQLLEGYLSHPVHHLAYPYGQPEDASEREIRIAAECGFSSAVTTRHGSVTESGGLHSLPRFSIREHVRASNMDAILSGFSSLLGRC